jgi:hypothetical protein
LGYLIKIFAIFLSPEFAAHLVLYILLPSGAEPLLALWLVVVGVHVQRWQEQANRAAASKRT